MIMLLRSRHCQSILKGIVVLTLLLHSTVSSAVQTPWGSRINGFAQHTLLWSDNNDFITKSDDTITSDITDVGLTLTHEFNRYWKFKGQVNSHKAGETSDGDPDLDFAYVQWQAISQPKHTLDLLAGRVVMRYGFNNELRDVAHSRPSIFSPYSIYYDRFRSTVFAHDGVGFDYRYLMGFNSTRFEAAFVVPRGTEDEIEQIVPAAGYQNPSSNGQEGYYWRLTYEEPLKAKYALSSVFLRWDYDADLPTGNPFLPFLKMKGGFNIGSTGLSVQQNFNLLTTTLEVFRHRAEYYDILPTGDLTIDLDAILLQVQTTCGPLECLVQYEQLASHKTDLTRATTTEDFGIGLGWKAMPNLTIRTEVHYVDGITWLQDAANATHEKWHYIATQFAWAF